MSKISLLRRLLNCPRFVPLFIAICWADLMAGFITPRQRKLTDWGQGIAILIPESGTPDLLQATLTHAAAALAQIQEPGEIIVLVNGAPRSGYAALQAAFPAVIWEFHDSALGFNGAIAAGLQLVRQPCVYLLNSDMRIAPDAISALLPWRQPQVFALGSQIFFPEHKRREETGWADYYLQGGRTVTYEKDPGSSLMVRGTLYASGGSSLFRTAQLREYVADTDGYSPFYWEDADWGARAWSEGMECLFVPTSRAVHEHRGTIKRKFSSAEVERISDRNALQFELRHHFSWLSGVRALAHLAGQPLATQRELASFRIARQIARQRLQSYGVRKRGFQFSAASHRFYSGVFQTDRPTVLWVTPFSIYPPAHGGARRIGELAQAVAKRVNLILLSDEQTGYQKGEAEDFRHYARVHILQARQDRAGVDGQALIQRMTSHAPLPLRYELRRLQQVYAPDLVQIEFMEASRLVEERVGTIPFVASLHDVYLNKDAGDAAQLAVLKQYQAVIACSDEDANYLHAIPHAVIPNGAVDRLDKVSPSGDARTILFMGPFRYAPNFEGILQFLRAVWPGILQNIPEARLVILGGEEALQPAYASELFTQPGVQLISEFVDPAPWLANCSLTINPQLTIRGSALKVAESVLAGRVCVSTREGARGFGKLNSEALVICSSWQQMQEEIVRLLTDTPYRHQLEATAVRDRIALGWQGKADQLLDLYQNLLVKKPSGTSTA